MNCVMGVVEAGFAGDVKMRKVCVVCGVFPVSCRGLCNSCYQKGYYSRPEVKQRLKQKMKERGVMPWQLCSDFNKYYTRVKRYSRRVGRELDEAALKKSFVKSVDLVIDGGIEFKVAKKLGIQYQKEAIK